MSIITPSLYKNDLRREIRSVKRLLRAGNYARGINRFRLEKFVFVSAFLMRKLLESKQLSDEMQSELCWGLRSEGISNSNISDYLNKFDIAKNYRTSERQEVQFSLADLTNLLIHSYLFTMDINDESIDEDDLLDNVNHFEMIFTSDWRKNSLYFLRLSVYLEICRKVCEDNIFYLEIGLVGPNATHRTILKKSKFVPRS